MKFMREARARFLKRTRSLVEGKALYARLLAFDAGKTTFRMVLTTRLWPLFAALLRSRVALNKCLFLA